MYQDWREFLQALNKNNVEYMVIGANAMFYYGYSRATGDLDVWISNHDKNASRMLDALRDFGFESLGLSKEDIRSELIIQLGHEPIRIDIIKEIDGLNFNEASLRKNFDNTQGVQIPYISLNDLIESKRSFDRNLDKGDIERLEKIREKEQSQKNDQNTGRKKGKQ